MKEKTSVSKVLIIKIRSEEDNVRVTQTGTVDVTFTSSLCGVFLLECSVWHDKVVDLSTPNMNVTEEGEPTR